MIRTSTSDEGNLAGERGRLQAEGAGDLVEATGGVGSSRHFGGVVVVVVVVVGRRRRGRISSWYGLVDLLWYGWRGPCTG